MNNSETNEHFKFTKYIEQNGIKGFVSNRVALIYENEVTFGNIQKITVKKINKAMLNFIIDLQNDKIKINNVILEAHKQISDIFFKEKDINKINFEQVVDNIRYKFIIINMKKYSIIKIMDKQQMCFYRYETNDIPYNKILKYIMFGWYSIVILKENIRLELNNISRSNIIYNLKIEKENGYKYDIPYIGCNIINENGEYIIKKIRDDYKKECNLEIGDKIRKINNINITKDVNIMKLIDGILVPYTKAKIVLERDDIIIHTSIIVGTYGKVYEEIKNNGIKKEDEKMVTVNFEIDDKNNELKECNDEMKNEMKYNEVKYYDKKYMVMLKYDNGFYINVIEKNNLKLFKWEPCFGYRSMTKKKDDIGTSKMEITFCKVVKENDIIKLVVTYVKSDGKYKSNFYLEEDNTKNIIETNIECLKKLKPSLGIHYRNGKIPFICKVYADNVGYYDGLNYGDVVISLNGISFTRLKDMIEYFFKNIKPCDILTIKLKRGDTYITKDILVQAYDIPLTMMLGIIKNDRKYKDIADKYYEKIKKENSLFSWLKNILIFW